MTAAVKIRDAQSGDAAALADLYNHYVANTVTTFELEPVSAEEMGSRVQDVVSWKLPWLVLVEDDELLGYACAVRWKLRAAYRQSCESTIYLRTDAPGRGRGTLLYGALLEQLKQLQIHTVMGGIALPNPASVALHEKLGFVKVAHFAEVGRKFDRWVDVGYWQRML
jgi:phosphinothricin acetyltransferase